MHLTFLQIVILGLVQGAAELLPVSSSAHVIVAEKLMGVDPSNPEMTFLLVMLHTGTMFAVMIYFWKAWRERYFSSRERFMEAAKWIVAATACTGFLGLGLKIFIEKVVLAGHAKAEVESLFSNLPLMAVSLAVAGVLILIAAARARGAEEVKARSALWTGLVQGLCLPFRGLSRSGATISTSLLCGTGRKAAEDFSFALAVVLTPPVVVLELHRLYKDRSPLHPHASLFHMVAPGLVGMACSLVAGLLALKLLSRWLESGRWQNFGYYCLFFAAVVFILSQSGY